MSKLTPVLALCAAMTPSLANAQDVAAFDLATVNFQQIGLDEGFTIRNQVAHFVSLRCPTCEGEHAQSIRIKRMTTSEWAGGAFRVPTKQDLDADCEAQMEMLNELEQFLEACESIGLPLPEPLQGIRGVITFAADGLNEWRSVEIGSVILHESGVVRVTVSDDRKERGLRHAAVFTDAIAQAISAEFEQAK